MKGQRFPVHNDCLRLSAKATMFFLNKSENVGVTLTPRYVNLSRTILSWQSANELSWAAWLTGKLPKFSLYPDILLKAFRNDKVTGKETFGLEINKR